jgi:hypothetical protein
MSNRKSHLWLEEPIVGVDGSLTISTVVESPQSGITNLWYRIPGKYAAFVTDSCDPLVVANVFNFMKLGFDCLVHGRVSPSLLRNLTEFQAAWSCWRPGLYKQVDIVGSDEVETAQADDPELAVAAFTGGADSCYTILSHKKGLCPRRWQRNLEAGLLIHGFDIPLEQGDAFERAAQKARETLASVGMELITMSTNHMTLNPDWEDTHIAGVASCLMLLNRRYGQGLIASGLDYNTLKTPWGSNPITDYLCSSNSFKIVHDGAAVTRVQKFKQIAKWEEGFSKLRVCFSANTRDENCGICSKCVFTIMALRIHGMEVPASFPQPLDAMAINLETTNAEDIIGFKKLITSARKANLMDPWVNVLSQRLFDS